jgi:hypothetical protein
LLAYGYAPDGALHRADDCLSSPSRACASHAAHAASIARHRPLAHTPQQCTYHTGAPAHATPVPAVQLEPAPAAACSVCECAAADCPGHHHELIYTHPSRPASATRSLYVGVVTREARGEVRVVGVRPGSPAHYAGVLPGDVVHSVGGVRVDATATMHQLFELHGRHSRVSECRPVNVTLRRHGRLVCLMVTPATRY